MVCNATPGAPRPSSTLPPALSRCSRPSSDNVVKPLSSYGKLPFRLVIPPQSGNQRSQRERTSGSRYDGTRWISRALRKSHLSVLP
ncbi:hypothetical protein DPMN_191519 [Dreissena polymorpha]|uniref:Uncharacterized protein n=1 Tax=Dreissena polymorpha TaxID=45954 RepID=A0A9D3XY79_DREPO|nr:hypothetical protein DPMN_191519 [Dreissena polymorpha]